MPEIDTDATDANTQTDFQSKLKKKPHNIFIHNKKREQTAKVNTKYTDKQRFRKYKTKVEPNLLKRIEVNDDEDMVNRIKEAFNQKDLNKNVVTAPTDSITMPAEFNNGVDELPQTRTIDLSMKDFSIDDLSPRAKEAHDQIGKELSEMDNDEDNVRLTALVNQKYSQYINAGKMPNTEAILRDLRIQKFILKGRSQKQAEVSDINKEDFSDITGTAAPFTDYTEGQLFYTVPTQVGNEIIMKPRLRQEGNIYFTPEEEDYIFAQADTQAERTRVANEILRERNEKAPRSMNDPGFLEYLKMVKEKGITDAERAKNARGHKLFQKLSKNASGDLRVEIPERRAPAQVSPSKSDLSAKTTQASGGGDNSHAAIFEKHPQLKENFPDILTYHNFHIRPGERKNPNNIKSYQDAYEYFIKTKRRNAKLPQLTYKDLEGYYDKRADGRSLHIRHYFDEDSGGYHKFSY